MVTMTPIETHTGPTIENPLTFSIVVNTTDRADSLRTLLRVLEHQSYPHFEVVVVVGPTHDNTLEVLAGYEGRVQVLRCPEANLSQSRNVGLLAAKGDIVAYIDDDAVPCYTWLAQFARLFQNDQLAATGGIVYAVHPQNPQTQHRIGVASSLAEQVNVRLSPLAHITPEGKGKQWVQRMMGTNMAFRRGPLLKVGGFDEFFVYIAEETDLALRLVNAGHQVQPVAEAPVYHVPASSRNRVVFTNVGRWWLRTRSEIYYSVKNGRAAGDSLSEIMLLSLHRVHGHWLWYGELRRRGQLSFFQLLRKSIEDLWAGMEGLFYGFFLPRKIIPAQLRGMDKSDGETILPFQHDSSQSQPAVDPVSGETPHISMPDIPLRLCLLSGTYPPSHYDGIGRHTNLMAKGLFERGHTVHVITRGDQEQVTFYDGAYVHTIPYALDRYGEYRRLSKLHHTLNYSHAVYDKTRRMVLNDGIQLADTPLWGVEGLVTAIQGDLPVIVRLQTSTRQINTIQSQLDTDNRLMGEIEQVLLSHAAALVPNSHATWRNVQNIYSGLDAFRPAVIPHGIKPIPDEVLASPPKRLAEHRPTVLYVGRLERRKGTHVLLEAIPRVLQKLPNLQFVLAGSDNSQHDGFQRQVGMSYPAYFQRKYPQYADRVTFLGYVSEEELDSLYHACDLFVAPSLYESFGLIYLEAMNYAKPVIGCQAGGIPEVVEHGVTGLLVEPDAVPPLAEAIVSLMSSPQRLAEMGQAGRRRLLDNFTHLHMAQAFEKMYRAALQDQRQRTGQ